MVRAFVDCIKWKDVECTRKLIHPGAMACLVTEYEPRLQSIADAVISLERANFDLAKVTWGEAEHVDGYHATVWTKFGTCRDG